MRKVGKNTIVVKNDSYEAISRKGKFQNLHASQIPREQKNYSYQILYDGPNNDFIDHLSRIVSSSPITTACLRETFDFVCGKGFNDDLGSIKINAHETLDQFHELVASDMVHFGRVCVKVVPDGAGRKTALYHVPAEWARWHVTLETQEIKNVVLNPFWNTSDERPHLNTIHPIYYLGSENRFDTTYQSEFLESVRKDSKQSQYQGHILFYNTPNPHNRAYSRPAYYASEDWIVTDFRIGQFHERNTANNFLLGGVLHVPGEPDQPILDENGNEYSTKGDEMEEVLKEWFAGTSEAGSIMLGFYQDPDRKLHFEPFDAGNAHEIVKGLSEETRKIISMIHGVPEVFLASQAGRMSANSEIAEAKELINERTARKRMTLEKIYTDLLTDFVDVSLPEEGVKITSLEVVNEVPDAVYDSLSVEGKNEYLERKFNIEEGVAENGIDNITDR